MREKEGRRVRAFSRALHVKLLPPSFRGKILILPRAVLKLNSREEGNGLGPVGTAGQPQWLEIASLD